MAKSRNTRRSKRQPKRNRARFEERIDALTALDLLRARLSEIDAVASAADDRIDAVPGRVLAPDQRRRLGQLVELVAATAKATREAVEYGERLAAGRCAFADDALSADRTCRACNVPLQSAIFTAIDSFTLRALLILYGKQRPYGVRPCGTV